MNGSLNLGTFRGVKRPWGLEAIKNLNTPRDSTRTQQSPFMHLRTIRSIISRALAITPRSVPPREAKFISCWTHELIR